MIVPLIHLNGTSKEQLLGDITNASAALHTALIELERMAPNARDYYPLGPSAYTQAVFEHNQRTQAVNSVRTQLVELHDAIVAQGRGGRS